MKKLIKVLSISAVVASSIYATNYIYNENASNRVIVELTAGVNKFDDDSRLSKSNTTFYGLRGTIYDSVVNKYGFQLAYEGAYGVDYKNLTDEDKANESDVHRILANLVIDGNEDYKITPYLFLGAGYEYLSDEIKGEVSQGIADLGLGFRYNMDYGFSASLEGKGIGKFDSNDFDYTIGIVLGYNFVDHITKQPDNDSKDTPLIKKEDVTMRVQANPRDIINRDIMDESAVEKTPEVVINEVTIEPQTSAIYSEDSIEPVTIDQSYYIQVAAYKTQDPQPTARRVKALGFDNVNVEQKDSSIGLLNVVLVGPYSSRGDAIRDLRKIKRVDRKAYVIKHW